MNCSFRFCAGLTGLLLASSALQQRSTAPVKHLRSINPYVAAAVSDWRRHCGLTAAIPLQASPGVLSGADALQLGSLAGTSSFGMSGINAHALVAQPLAPVSSPAGSDKVSLLHAAMAKACLFFRRPVPSALGLCMLPAHDYAFRFTVHRVEGSRGVASGARLRPTRCCNTPRRAWQLACCACSAA